MDEEATEELTFSTQSEIARHELMRLINLCFDGDREKCEEPGVVKIKCTDHGRRNVWEIHLRVAEDKIGEPREE